MKERDQIAVNVILKNVNLVSLFDNTAKQTLSTKIFSCFGTSLDDNLKGLIFAKRNFRGSFFSKTKNTKLNFTIGSSYR